MGLAAGLVLLGIVVLYSGAEALVRGSASIAARAGLTPLAIGLTVVAFGTSMPELVVSVKTALEDEGAISVGNVVGSNICNIALILGLSALIRPPTIHAHVLRRDLPILVGTSTLLAVLLLDQRLDRVEGGALFAGLVAFTAWALRAGRRESRRIQREFEEVVPRVGGSALGDAALVAGGLVLLVVGARWLVGGAVTIAAAFGLSDAVIGLTVIAVGTSLPELATSVLAAARGESDIAVGNILGSNIFNILGILGFASLVRPLAGVGMSAVDLAVMVLVSLVLLPLMRSGYRLSRREGAGLLAAYAIYVGWLLA